ncbi:glycosyltransferase family 2 protein [Vibrio sp. M60_M70]|uniref:glycosyltransferase family 2 protein n=1 Tax=Vibrio sp. M60_M70 TaxID=3035166 RepID=UPI00301B8B38
MLLSIVIPTKNRYHTLIPVVENIIDNIDGNYEIVIQDNSEIKEDLSSKILNDSRVKYFYTFKSMPISDNTELAIENSSGKYILFIGDDDFVSPKVVDAVELMEKHSLENLTYEAGYYWWNTVEFYKTNFYHDKEKLWLPKDKSMVLKSKNSKCELEKFYRRGGVSIGGLPRVYHGITKRSVLEKVKESTGNYVVGSCPDISLSISISLIIDEFHFVSWPLTIYGGSKGSGGGMTASKKHFAKIEEMPWLRDNISKRWYPKIPRLWSERTIYPQTSIEVHEAFGERYPLDFYEMYAALFSYEPHLKRFWLDGYKHSGLTSHLTLFLKVIKKIIGQIVSKSKYKLKLLPYNVSVETLDTLPDKLK